VVSLNVHSWQDRWRRSNTRRVAALLRQLRPHILCLQVRVCTPPPRISSTQDWMCVWHTCLNRRCMHDRGGSPTTLVRRARRTPRAPTSPSSSPCSPCVRLYSPPIATRSRFTPARVSCVVL
jgi:hypothetical protein